MNARVDINEAGSAPYEESSASLLTQQPLTTAAPKDAQNWISIYNHLESRLLAMRSWRWSWWSAWSILAQFFVPKRYLWVVVANRQNKGSPLNESIVDSTGTLAVRTCRSGMWTGLTSPSRPWFKLDIGLPWIKLEPDGQAWLEDTQQRIYTVLKQSNFYNIMAQAFEDVVVFGTAPPIIYEDFEDVIRLYLPCAGEYFLDVGARLENDTIYREFSFNVIQIVGMFTLANCPKQVQDAWREGGGRLQSEFVICHAIEPNFAIADRGRNADDQIFVVPQVFPYREVYWLKGIKTPAPLSKRGFHVRPFMALKWSSVSNDPYGRGPGMDAIGDQKQIQQETRRKAEFIDKGVRPPMGADPALKNEPASIIPAHITYMDTSGGKKGFFPLFEPNPQWLPAITGDIKIVADRIDRCMYVDLFMAISRMEGVQPRNQLELSKRDLERLQELGPVIDLAEKELDVAIIRILNIMTRRRMLKPVPPSLQNVPLKITYTSIMRLAQRAAESISMKDVFQTGGALSSAAKAAGVPDPIRTVNLDKAFRHYADLSEFPATLFYTDGEVAQHDQIRQQEMQKAQIPGQAMAGVQAAKTLADTSTGPGSALSAMLGRPGS